jgi:hypothetical protein
MRFQGWSFTTQSFSLGFDGWLLNSINLCSLLMCPTELLHEQAGWDGPISSSRERLLADLSSKKRSLKLDYTPHP